AGPVADGPAAAGPVADGPAPAGPAPASRRDPVLARLAVRLDRRGGPADGAPFDWAASPDHCRMAYLRGRFLARGSLSIAGARTHLEFVVDPGEAPQLASWLEDAGMPASWRIRRGRGVVTWKSGEVVGLFLRRIGAGAALLELEARQVSRAMRGELNRILNAESSNLQRSVAAAGRQLAAIDRLEADGRLGEQPYTVRAVAEARRETPEATLADLAERLGLHRSGVQRALERLERLAMGDEAPSSAEASSSPLA
ncbi:MAG: DNA-binding protein WhiA, partial [Chloroflexota bacterium]